MPSRKVLLAISLTLMTIATAGGPAVATTVKLREPDGGTRYFHRFAHHGAMGAPGYFPLWLWGQYDMTRANIARDKSLGFNGYYGLANTGRDANLGGIAAAGMVAVLGGDFWNRGGDRKATVGWLLDDEVDMCNGCPRAGFAARERELRKVPKDGRFRFANYSKGVGFWWNDRDAGRFVNGTRTRSYQDVVSADHYWFNDPDLRDTSQGQCFYGGCGGPGHAMRNLTVDQAQRAYNYALTIRRLRELDARDGRREPIFGQIEMGWPTNQGYRRIQPAELHAALWQSIIAGARGVVYFPFTWKGSCVTQHIQRDTSGCYTAIQDQVRADNALVKQLAPVINGKFADGYVAVSHGIDAMAKAAPGGRCYVFAGNTDNAQKAATFTLNGLSFGRAEVIGEDRGIPITNGSFSDSFADGNAVHIYRISGAPGATGCVPSVQRVGEPVSLRSGGVVVPAYAL